jgi:hypothetical protein
VPPAALSPAAATARASRVQIAAQTIFVGRKQKGR